MVYTFFPFPIQRLASGWRIQPLALAAPVINRLPESFSNDLHGSLARFSMADHSGYLKVTPDVVQSARYDSVIYPAQFVAGRLFRPLRRLPA